MPLIVTRSPRTRQPQGVVRAIDRVLARPVFLATPGQAAPVLAARQQDTYPAEIGGGSALVFSGQPQQASQSGPGVLTDAANKFFSFKRVGSSFDAYVEIPSGSDYTWLFQTDVSSWEGANPGWFRAGPSGNTFVLLPSAGLWVRHAGSDYTSSAARPAAGMAVTVVVAVRSGVSVRAWVNGTLVIDASTSSSTADVTGANGVNYFGYHSSTEYVAGIHTLVALWHAELPSGHAQKLSANPWQIFAPLERRIWVPSASSAVPSITAVYADSVTASSVVPRVTLDYA